VRPDVAIPKSPFGPEGFTIWSYNMTVHRAMTLVITVVLVIAVWAWMNKTRAGVNVRAISDDVEAARWSGIRLVRVGIGSYAAAGALSALAGALLAPVAGTDLQSILHVFFRALTVAVVGGFRSPAFALVGCLVLSLTENFIAIGAAGDIGPGTRETVILVVMVGTALAVAKLRKAGQKLQVEAL
jgi:branched-chain amino acid transport system permease protein